MAGGWNASKDTERKPFSVGSKKLNYSEDGESALVTRCRARHVRTESYQRRRITASPLQSRLGQRQMNDRYTSYYHLVRRRNVVKCAFEETQGGTPWDVTRSRPTRGTRKLLRRHRVWVEVTIHARRRLRTAGTLFKYWDTSDEGYWSFRGGVSLSGLKKRSSLFRRRHRRCRRCAISRSSRA